MAATIKIPAEFTAIDKFSNILGKMGSGVRNFATVGSSAINRFDSKVTKTFQRIGRVSQMAIGLGIGGVFAAAVSNNIDYNSSLMEVSSITGATGKSLSILEGHAMNVAKSTKMMAKDVLAGFTEIASAKPELLKTPQALANITKSAIVLSKASKLDLKTAADSLTTSLNQFGLGSNMATMAIDALSAGSVYGSSKIPETAEALSKFGTIAANTGTKLNESIALIQLVSPFEKGAEAGTKLRNVLGKIAGAKILPKEHQEIIKSFGVDLGVVTNAALPLNERLLEFSKIASDSNAVIKIFGVENSVVAQALVNNAGGFAKMLEDVNKVGMAEDQASKNTSAFGAKLIEMKNMFFNVTTATNSENRSLMLLGNSMDWVSNNMETIVGVGAGVFGLFGAMKAIVWGSKAAMVAYNIALGIHGAISGAASIAIGKNAVALGAYKTAQIVSTGLTWLLTTAQTALAAATWASMLPILAVVAAIAAVVAIFYYWDDITAWFGKQWGNFTNWIGEAWNNVVKWFKEFDFIGFFRGIGQSILKFLLTPMRMMLELASKIPGKIGSMAQDALGKISDLTGDGEIAVKNTREAIDSPEMQVIKSNNDMKDAVLNGSLNINLSDPGKMVKSTSKASTGMPVKINRTQGAF